MTVLKDVAQNLFQTRLLHCIREGKKNLLKEMDFRHCTSTALMGQCSVVVEFKKKKKV